MIARGQPRIYKLDCYYADHGQMYYQCISALPFVLPVLTRARQASRHYSCVTPQEAASQIRSDQHIGPDPVLCMALDLMVEACDRVRYKEGVYASVMWAYDIARNVAVQRKLVGLGWMVA